MIDPATPNPGDDCRILIVDEDQTAYQQVCQLLARAIPNEQHLTRVATIEETTVALARNEYALCILNAGNSQRLGLELPQAIRAQGFRLPLLLLCHAGEEEFEQKALAAGASDFLVMEELTPSLLHRTIRYALERERHAQANQSLTAELAREAAGRRRAEEALQQSETQRHALFTGASDFVAVLDPGGIILDINAATATLLGAASSEEIIGQPLDRFVAAEPPPAISRLRCAISRGESGSEQFELIGFNGARRRMEGRTEPFWRADLQVTCSLVVARDITEQQQPGTALPEPEARDRLHAQLLDAVGHAVIATRPDGTVFYWNRAAEQIYGWTAQEVLGRDVLEIAPAESSLEQARQIMEQLARGGGWSGEFTVRRRNGEVFAAWVTNTPLFDEAGRLAGIIGTSIDLTEQKRSETALQESETWFRRLSEANILGTCSWRPDGLIFQANDAFLRMTGYSRRELEQGRLNWRAMTPPEYRSLDDQIVRDLFERGVVAPHEKEYWRKDGTRLPVVLVAARLDDTEDQGVAYILDRTEQRRAEQAREETLAILQTITEGTTDAVFVKDLDSRYLMINSAGARFVGRSVEEVVGRSDAELFSSDTVGQVIDGDQRALATGETFTTEEVITASGVTRTYLATKGPFRDTTGAIVGTFGISRDITQRKADERALQESEARFRAMAESFPHGLYLTTPDGHAVYANPEALRQSGLSTHAQGTHEWAHTVHPDDRERVVAEWLAALERGGGFNCVHRFLHPDGKIVWVRSQTAPVWVGGTLLGYVGIVEDITQIRHLEQQLQQSQKMEAIGRMAGGIAHDFNNLLAVINGYSEIAQMKLPPDSTISGYLEEVRKAGDRAAGLTRQLLAFSRKQVLAPKVLDPNHLIAELQKMLARLIGEDMLLETELSPEVNSVFADPGQLEQVLLNLAVNARDAMPQGGRLRLSTRNVSAEEVILPLGEELLPIDYVLIEVQDWGSGMSPEVKARIFEPFFTTKGVGEGTGLGLAVVHGIVAQSGGQITVESEPGVGTKFGIYLPGFEAPAQTSEPISQPLALPRGTESILLVEDDEAVRRLTSRVLRNAGYQVLEAQDANEALVVAERHSGAIDLLATDIVLPGKSGRHLAQELRERQVSLPVLYLSGYTDDAVVRHGVLVDEVDILQKPFSTDDLVRKVRTVLDAARDTDSGRGRTLNGAKVANGRN